VARVPRAVLDLLATARADRPPDPAEERRAAIGTLHDFEALVADRPDTARWSAIATPTLLLHGTDTWDPVPASTEALAAALPRATRVALEGQSHFATATAPELVADALARFYDEARARSRTAG
jgi:pimeloyl-ACP methyl ester carboxylesterase